MRPLALLRVVSPAAVLAAAVVVLSSAGCSGSHAHGASPTDMPTVAPPEFRAVFVSTAYNLDWPYKMNLHPNEQISEIHAIVDRAKELNFNVVILQVRSFGDRLHRDSTLDIPDQWGGALSHGHDPDKTGKYDPLSEWVTACHAQGLELHAWLNPFRVDHLITVPHGGTLPVFINNAAGGHLFLDPSKKSVYDYSLKVIVDLIRWRPRPAMVPDRTHRIIRAHPSRDDGIDGFLFDHYLPDGPGGTTYPAAMALRARQPQPQAASRIGWLNRKARQKPVPNDQAAKLDDFVRAAYERACKAGLKFGISPDWDDKRALGWIQHGWCHYVVPEIYDTIKTGDPRGFESKLKFWLDGARASGPIVVAGLMTARVQTPDDNGNLWTAPEIEEQIRIARACVGSAGQKAGGQAHYSWSALRSPAQGGPRPPYDIGEKLKIKSPDNNHYEEPCPVPACVEPLPDADVPKAPKCMVTLDSDRGRYTAFFASAAPTKEKIRFWAVWLHSQKKGWGPMQVISRTGTVTFDKCADPAEQVDRVAARALDRYNRISEDWGIGVPP